MARITVKDIIELINPDHIYTDEKVQICRPDEDYECFDELLVTSPILIPLYSATVKTIEMIDKDILRINPDWSTVSFYECEEVDNGKP